MFSLNQPSKRSIPRSTKWGLGVSCDCLPATQSMILAFSEEVLEISRIFAGYLQRKGTRESPFRPGEAKERSILSVEDRAGAPSHLVLYQKNFRQGIAFQRTLSAGKKQKCYAIPSISLNRLADCSIGSRGKLRRGLNSGQG